MAVGTRGVEFRQRVHSARGQCGERPKNCHAFEGKSPDVGGQRLWGQAVDKSAGLAVIHIRTFHRAKRSAAAPPYRRTTRCRLLRPEVTQGAAGEAEGVPFVHGEGAEGAVEIDGGLIPLEDAPLDT